MRTKHVLEGLGWTLSVAIAFFYAGFAMLEAWHQALVQLGAADAALFKPRGAPGSFILHAVTGGIALALSPMQLNARIRARASIVHRWLGRIYAAAVIATAALTVPTA